MFLLLVLLYSQVDSSSRTSLLQSSFFTPQHLSDSHLSPYPPLPPSSQQQYSLSEASPLESGKLKRFRRFVKISFNDKPPKYSGYPYFFGRYFSPEPRNRRPKDGFDGRKPNNSKSLFSLLFGR